MISWLEAKPFNLVVNPSVEQLAGKTLIRSAANVRINAFHFRDLTSSHFVR